MNRGLLLYVLIMGWLCGPVSAQMAGDVQPTSADSPQYLLLNKGLQFRITEAVNSLYNFDFETAERGFKVMAHSYPEHPLPYFLMGLSQWWKITPDTENEIYDDVFFKYMDRSEERRV